jgi:hypothetical protein
MLTIKVYLGSCIFRAIYRIYGIRIIKLHSEILFKHSTTSLSKKTVNFNFVYAFGNPGSNLTDMW